VLPVVLSLLFCHNVCVFRDLFAFFTTLVSDFISASSAEVKEYMELYLPSPDITSLRGAQFKNHRDNFTFTFASYSGGLRFEF